MLDALSEACRRLQAADLLRNSRERARRRRLSTLHREPFGFPRRNAVGLYRCQVLPQPSLATRVPTSLLLAASVVGEVAGTASLRLSEGLTRPVFVVGVVLLYGGSIAIFGRVLHRGMGLGVAYGVLTASGLMAATLLSLVAFDEHLSLVQVGGILVLGVGAVLLQMDRS